MWFSKETLDFILDSYKCVYFFKEQVFFTSIQNFWRRNLDLKKLKKFEIKDLRTSTLILKDLNNYVKFSRNKIEKMNNIYIFYLKYHLIFNEFLLNNYSTKTFYSNLFYLKKKKTQNLLSLILFYKNFLNLIKVKYMFLFNILFYLDFIFIIDSYLFLLERYVNLKESFDLFDLNFIMNFKFILILTLTYKQRMSLWKHLRLPMEGSKVYFKWGGRWIQNKNVLKESNRSFINSLNLKTFFDFWKENVFKFNNEQHVILNLIYNKYNLNVIKLSYLDSKVLFLNNKSNFLKKSKKNSNFITNTDRFYINKFSMYFNKKKVFKKVKKSKKIPDPLFFKSLDLINSNNLKLVFYFYIFSYIKKLYNISINFLFNIEFLYLKKKWKKKKISLFTRIFMIFLILINRLNCKFKFSFYKLIFSLYFFLLKYYNELDFNLLSQVKKNYFFFIWTDYIKKQFLDLFISNEVGLLNPLWSYKYDFLNKKIYYYYFKFWKMEYINLNLKLKKKERIFKKVWLKFGFNKLKNIFLFKKVYELYRLGTYSFWSLYYQKNILKLKILYLNLLFDKLYSDHKVLKLKKRIKVKPGTLFNFFLFSFFFQVIQDKKFYFCKSNFNKILKFFDFKILKDVFIYFSYLIYLNKKKKKYSINNLSYFNVTYTYLMQDKGILLNFIKLVVNTIIFHFFNFFFKSKKGLIDFIFIKKGFLTCFFTNLYFFFLKDLTLVKYYNKVFIDYHLLGLIRKSKKNLKLSSDLCSSKIFYKQNLVENLLTNSQKLDGFLSLYKKFFIQDIVYFFNDQFLFTDDRLDLYLDTQLSFFFKSDVFLDFQNLILSVDWLKKKASIVKEKPGIFFFKTKVFKFLKKFSLLLCDDYTSLDLNFNAVEFSGNIYGALRVDAKKKFNLYAIFLSKILSLVVEREELTKRRKFNLRLWKRFYVNVFVVLVDANLLLKLNLLFEDWEYYFYDQVVLSTAIINRVNKERSDFNLLELDKKTEFYIFLNNKKYYQLTQVHINMSLFFNLFYYYLFIIFKKINFYLYEFKRISILLERDFDLLVTRYNLHLSMIKISNNRFIYNHKYNNETKLVNFPVLKNVNNFVFNRGFIFDKFFCKICTRFFFTKSQYNFICGLKKGLKRNKEFNKLLKFTFKFCNICNMFTLVWGGNSVKAYSNKKYLLNDLTYKGSGFFVFDNKLLYLHKTRNNVVLYKNILLLNIKIGDDLLPINFLFFDVGSLFKHFENPNVWTNVAFSSLCLNITEFFKENLSSKKLGYRRFSLKESNLEFMESFEKNWIVKRRIWRSLTKEERLEIKLAKQTEDLRKIGKKEV